MSKSAVIRVTFLKNQALIADKCIVAKEYFTRLRGLIGRPGLEPGEAMWFPNCNSVHMWFMRFPIDVVFLRRGLRDGEWEITAVRENVQPWRLLPLGSLRASETLELPAGTVSRFAMQSGDLLCTN